MEDNGKINITNLDFYSIKNSLIGFLKNQEEFKGFSYEGSAINVLLDLFAYNTYYNGIYNNYVLSESFLDSATKRNSIVSLAKHLGYIPKSAKPAKATVNIKQSAEDYLSTANVIPKNTVIRSKDSNGNTISFILDKNYTLEPYELNDDGTISTYAAKDVTLIQGLYNTFSDIISEPLQKIKIPFKNIDIDSLRAFVVKSVTDNTGIDIEWKVAKDITSVTSESYVFFISETVDGFYEIQFGDDVFGKKVQLGNVVIIEFLVTSGVIGNNIGINDTATFSSFTLDNFDLETVQFSTGGSDKEDLESIRRNALRNFSTQDRAVTASDYEALILKLFGSVESVRCWGGEDNDPPQYGKVFAAIKPKNSPFLTSTEKNEIIMKLLEDKSVVGVTLEIRDPDILYLNFDVTIKYDPNLTTATEEVLKQRLTLPIVKYAIDNYKGFDDDFFASDFIDEVNNYNRAIVSVIVSPTMEKRIFPRLNSSGTYTLDFENLINEDDTIMSTKFYSSVDVNGSILNKLCHIEEINGTLNLCYFNGTTKIVAGIVGTVNKGTGRIVITVNPTAYENDIGYIAIMCKPVDVDVMTKKYTTLSVDPLSNRLLNITMSKVYRNSNQSVSSSNR